MRGVHSGFFSSDAKVDKQTLAELGHAKYWDYDPYMRHQCEATRTDCGRCRRISRCAYIWPGRTLYLCGVHGRSHDPLPEAVSS